MPRKSANSIRRAFERNDCTVRAYAAVADLPYDTAHKILEDLGRKPQHRFPFTRIVDFDPAFQKLEMHGAKFNKWTGRMNGGFTTATFLRDNPVGRFVLSVPGHVFAVVNGAVVDDGKLQPRRIVKQVWQYHKAEVSQ